LARENARSRLGFLIDTAANVPRCMLLCQKAMKCLSLAGFRLFGDEGGIRPEHKLEPDISVNARTGI
jgi:hypothetical protein